MKTLWTVGRRMRNASSVNEDRESSSRWILDFAKKVCPDSVPVKQVLRDAFADRDNMNRPFSMIEFSLALLLCNNSAPGMDRIRFNLPPRRREEAPIELVQPVTGVQHCSG